MDNVEILEAFEHGADGSWTCRVPATILTPEGELAISPGQTFTFGERHGGLDIAEYLEQLGASFGS